VRRGVTGARSALPKISEEAMGRVAPGPAARRSDVPVRACIAALSIVHYPNPLRRVSNAQEITPCA